MIWEDEMWRCWEQQKAFEREKATTARNDVSADVSDLSALVITSDYSGPSPMPMIREVLKKATGLRRLHIGLPLSWEDVCSLDLGNIESLWIKLDDMPGQELLKATKLKELTIYGKEVELTPLEIMMHPVLHLDYSGVPELNRLYLAYFPQIDPSDFKHLKKLSDLIIKGWPADNLKWLTEADYKLRRLYLEDVIADCAEIAYQEELERIEIHYSKIIHPEHLGRLRNLKYVNFLYQNTFEGEHNPNDIGIDKLYISQMDKIRYNIESSVRLFMENAIRVILMENNRLQRNEEKKPRLIDKNLLLDVERPLKERVIKKVFWSYKQELERCEDPNSHGYMGLSKEEHCALFKETAEAYYPFLAQFDSIDDVFAVLTKNPSEDDIRTNLGVYGISWDAYSAFKKRLIDCGLLPAEDIEKSDEYNTAIQRFINENPSMRVPASRMKYARTDGNTVYIVFHKTHLMNMRLMERKKATFESVLSEVYGRTMHVIMTIGNDKEGNNIDVFAHVNIEK